MTAVDQKPTKPNSVSADTKTGDEGSARGKLTAEIGTDYNFQREIVWKNALGFLALHVAALYGQYLCFYCHKATLIWAVLTAIAGAEGVTIGAHRLYCHRTFKATFGLRVALIILHTIAGQNCMYIWVRDHRQHHKFSDTDADPHNAHRGFFFSHIGWLMSRKHPAVIEKGKTIDMSDLEADPLVMFQKKYYKPLYAIFAIYLPVAVPIYFWNETLLNSFFISYMWRYIMMLNATWCVNSVAHLWGTKPFDKYILPVESSFVALISIGEGWHNYHHTFPWDYRAAELGSKYCITTFVIDLLAYFGLAYDLRTAPYRMIKSKAIRTGDGSHPVYTVKRINYGAGEESSVVDDSENEKLYNMDNILEKGKKIIPEVGQRAMTVQG